MKLFKSNILILYAMTEFYNRNIIYNQYNPFEITKIILSERCNLIENITNILKNMKIDNIMKKELFIYNNYLNIFLFLLN